MIKPLAIFYGNCQMTALVKILRLKYEYNIKTIDCHKTKWTIDKFTRFIKRAKLIIMTYTKKNYRDKSYLSTEYILKNCNSKANVIVVPSIYFNGYYPDIKRIKNSDDKILIYPTETHHSNIFKYARNKKTINQLLNEVINNDNFYSTNYLESIVQNSLKELRKRETEIMDMMSIRKYEYIIVSDYIETYFRNTLLFYTINHPTKKLIQYVAKEIHTKLKKANAIKIVYSNINNDIDPLTRPQCILYKSIQKIVKFDINNHEPSIDKHMGINRFVELCYNEYKKKENEEYKI